MTYVQVGNAGTYMYPPSRYPLSPVPLPLSLAPIGHNTYGFTHARTHTCTHARTRTHTHTHTHTDADKYARTHTHTHTHMRWKDQCLRDPPEGGGQLGAELDPLHRLQLGTGREEAVGKEGSKTMSYVASIHIHVSCNVLVFRYIYMYIYTQHQTSWSHMRRLGVLGRGNHGPMVKVVVSGSQTHPQTPRPKLRMRLASAGLGGPIIEGPTSSYKYALSDVFQCQDMIQVLGREGLCTTQLTCGSQHTCMLLLYIIAWSVTLTLQWPHPQYSIMVSCHVSCKEFVNL